MFATIISDCQDNNARGRQLTRLSAFLDTAVHFVGVSSDLEAAGCLLDILDAAEGDRGVVLVNVAPRHGAAQERWSNGTPFGYFYYQNTLVISSVDGLTLSLAKKLGLVGSVKLLDIAEVAKALDWSEDTQARVASTQFRSYEFLPRIAKALLDGADVSNTGYELVEDAPQAVWYVDNFGNMKTTLLPEEAGFEPGEVIKTQWGHLRCFTQLAQVSSLKSAIVLGSSGIADKRFLEVVIQGQSAAERFKASINTPFY